MRALAHALRRACRARNAPTPPTNRREHCRQRRCARRLPCVSELGARQPLRDAEASWGALDRRTALLRRICAGLSPLRAASAAGGTVPSALTSALQPWCGAVRKEEAHRLLLVDPHSPAQYRVIGSVSNSHDFLAAFGCPKTAKMAAGPHCRVW